MSKWKPISEAPKDGTRILVVRLGNHPTTGEPFEPAIAHWFSDMYGWQEDGLDPQDYADNWELTHWMQLPSPPTTGQEQ